MVHGQVIKQGISIDTTNPPKPYEAVYLKNVSGKAVYTSEFSGNLFIGICVEEPVIYGTEVEGIVDASVGVCYEGIVDVKVAEAVNPTDVITPTASGFKKATSQQIPCGKVLRAAKSANDLTTIILVQQIAVPA